MSAPYQPPQAGQQPPGGYPSQAAPSAPAGWFPDPFGRHESRYYDGSRWTEHVANNGATSVDPPVGQSNVPVDGRPRSGVVGDLARAGVTAGEGAGTGSILTEPVLVVNQKAKLIEINNEYAIYDQNAVQIGAIREVGQSTAKKAMRLLTRYDQFMTHKLQIVDMGGNVLMQVTRPAKVMKSRVILQDGYGQELGVIVQQNVFGKIRFAIEVAGQNVGSINAENWRAWDFNLKDAAEREIGRVTKTWAGLARAAFTTADNYVVQIDPSVTGSLRAVAIASALAIDTALKQDSRGPSLI
ncbi:MAG: DUF2510 domain-containing protein [Frankiaceae bacterium]|nr:DUF2510 domain-containing protein [Frankiaceae bacterium]